MPSGKRRSDGRSPIAAELLNAILARTHRDDDGLPLDTPTHEPRQIAGPRLIFPD